MHRAMAIKPKDLKFEEAALHKRLEFVRSLKKALQDQNSIAAQTVNAYSSIVDGKQPLTSFVIKIPVGSVMHCAFCTWLQK